MLKTLIRDVGDFLYPPRCIACFQASPPQPLQFCQQCNAALTELTLLPPCERCAAPLGESAECAHCAGKGLHPLSRIAALGPFRDPLRKLLHQMKFHHRWIVAEILADQMLDRQRVQKILADTDLLIPVPLYWSRQISRGYNQADAIVRQLASHHPKIRIAHPLVRLKNTAPQTNVRSAADRAINMRLAFSLKSQINLAGKRITLVDDVMTTGSTLKAAARELNKANPFEINALVLAVADPKHHDFESA